MDELKKISTTWERALDRPALKNAYGRESLAELIPRFNNAAYFAWQTEDLRRALLADVRARLAAVP